jgi:sec-independent protein translocase protein TatA
VRASTPEITGFFRDFVTHRSSAAETPDRTNDATLALVPFGIGIWEIAILLLVALLIFGPKRLPEMGRSLGRGMREFKDSVTGKDHDEDDDDRFAELPPAREDEIVPTPSSAPSRKRKAAS